ncbi:NADPH-dependent cytochrome P450 oxidoreductase [Babesia caballi]|uniref:NADPH-dependent cytochrome P450 oxidoreductase n=1 Tax=Babesia caballi TaxID=5871 RepID=A0AAV4LX42_BABCB|nr:NADPH-dependent cytochrome P450 oxidoreductase [Babesia caballi]
MIFHIDQRVILHEFDRRAVTHELGVHGGRDVKPNYPHHDKRAKSQYAARHLHTVDDDIQPQGMKRAHEDEVGVGHQRPKVEENARHQAAPQRPHARLQKQAWEVLRVRARRK